MMREIDEWYNENISNIEDHELLVCQKYLRQFDTGSAVFRHPTFAWMTMGSCCDAAMVIASKLAFGTDSDHERRCDAMSLMIQLAPLTANAKISADLIKEILQEQSRGLEDRMATVRLIKIILNTRYLWIKCKHDVGMALAAMSADVNIGMSGAINTKALAVVAARQILGALYQTIASERELYSVGPFDRHPGISQEAGPDMTSDV